MFSSLASRLLSLYLRSVEEALHWERDSKFYVEPVTTYFQCPSIYNLFCRKQLKKPLGFADNVVCNTRNSLYMGSALISVYMFYYIENNYLFTNKTNLR